MQVGGESAPRRQGRRAACASRDDHHRRQDDDRPRQPLPDAGGLRAAGRRRAADRARRGARDKQGNLKKVEVESVRYVESDTALVNRLLGREVGGKQNILVLNDEAHHAYRIRREEPDEDEEDLYARRGGRARSSSARRPSGSRGWTASTSCAASTSASICRPRPTSSARVGQDTNRPFPWVVSDFGLTDAIESGLVKIPQLAVRDTTGAEIPGYFNIWRWILPQAHARPSAAARRANPKPEAILKYAHTPDRHARRPVGGAARRVGAGRRTTRGRRCSSSSARTRRSRRSSTSGWPRTSRRPASRRRTSTGFRNRDGRDQHDPRRLARSSTRRTPSGAKSDESRVDAASRSTPSARSTGRATRRAGRSIPRGSRSWRRSWAGRCTRRAATCAASSASAC